jgi:meso-butanediol dehydrogenase/(S,S)-butanediol dehydrogenase/diacetyl reductase
MTARLAGKVAIVTGSTRGLGEAIATRFAAEGAAVVVTGRDAERGAGVVAAIRSAGNEATFVRADLAREDEVAALIDAAIARYKTLTTLVNNGALVSVALGDGPVADLPNSALDLAYAVNVRGIVWTCKYALPHLLAAGGAAIVNISSLVGQVASPGAPAYSISKAAVDSLTRSMARAYGKQNLRVNAVSPGVIEAGEHFAELLSRPYFQKTMVEPIVLPYLGTPDDVASACLFLASDEARFITNVILPVNGGIHI